MLIGGFLPTTLLDYPEKLACTIFTCGCNFRCPFCQNGSLVLEELSDSADKEYDDEKILQILNKRKNILEGVCITGGEPTIQKGLKDFIIKIKELGLLVKLDTNGTRPETIKELYQEHLIDYVAMDIKSSKENYSLVAGIAAPFMNDIEESVRYLINSGIPYEFRTTLVKGLHTSDDMRSITGWIAGAKKYYLQSYQDSDLILAKYQSPTKTDISLENFSLDDLQQFLEIARQTIPSAELRGVD